VATPSVRTPNIDDGGTLVSGNIQIHPQLAKSTEGACPPPSPAGNCSP
jgi:hypothetical protein